MNPSLLGTSTAPLLEQVVGFTQERHGVLAGNIANLDTPGYKTRDLSPELFQESLKRAADASRQPASAGQPKPAEAFAEVKESLKSMLRHDGADVGLEQQIAELSKNHSQHNLAVSLLANQFQLLRAAITERNV